MATARRGRSEEVVLRRRRCDDGGNGSGAFDLIDRPLRLAAGDDAALLRIFRVALAGSVLAAVGAVTFSAIT